MQTTMGRITTMNLGFSGSLLPAAVSHGPWKTNGKPPNKQGSSLSVVIHGNWWPLSFLCTTISASLVVHLFNCKQNFNALPAVIDTYMVYKRPWRWEENNSSQKRRYTCWEALQKTCRISLHRARQHKSLEAHQQLPQDTRLWINCIWKKMKK